MRARGSLNLLASTHCGRRCCATIACDSGAMAGVIHAASFDRYYGVVRGGGLKAPLEAPSRRSAGIWKTCRAAAAALSHRRLIAQQVVVLGKEEDEVLADWRLVENLDHADWLSGCNETVREKVFDALADFLET